MTRRIAVVLFACAMSLSACLAHMTATNVADALNVEAARKGSPYRWDVVDLKGDNARLEPRLIGTPSVTSADDVVKSDVMAAIAKSGAANGWQNPTLIDVRLMSRREGEVTEVWLVSWGEFREIYRVSMNPSPEGGVDFRVGPAR